MSIMKRKDETQNLKDAIDLAVLKLTTLDPTSNEYATIVDQLDKLYKMRITTKPQPVPLEALIAVGGNLIGIVSIIGFERANVLTSKALGFVLKSRI